MITADNYYSDYKIVDDADCVICREPLTGIVQAHDKLHPIHEACIKLWLKVHGSCPICRVSIDIGTLFSWRERISMQLTHVPRVAAGIAGTCAMFGTMLMFVPDQRLFSWTKTLGSLVLGPELIRRCMQPIPHGPRETLSIYHVGASAGSFATMGGVIMLGFNLATVAGDMAEEITGQRWLRPLGFAALPAAVSLTAYIAKKIL